MAKGKHPAPFRTRKLSLSAPMVLHGGPCGRLGRRRTNTLQGRSFVTGPEVFLRVDPPSVAVWFSGTEPLNKPTRETIYDLVRGNAAFGAQFRCRNAPRAPTDNVP